MTARIWKRNGRIVHRATYRHLTQEEILDEGEKAEREEFTRNVNEKIDSPLTAKDSNDIDQGTVTPKFELYSDDVETNSSVRDIDDVTSEEFDQYIGAEVLLPKGNSSTTGRVKQRKRDADGNLTGKSNANPILDTRTYEVEFPDGEVNEYSANVIAENMWSQCDDEGNQFLLLDAIVDYRKDGHAVGNADRYIIVKGKRVPRKTTKGWHLCVQWRDGSTSWERLADLKESNPVDVAEFAKSRCIDHEPAFAWWVPYTLKKRNLWKY